MSLNRTKGQGLAEYALLISVVVMAIVSMQVYVKRGLQARYKTIVNCSTTPIGLTQYEPYYVDQYVPEQKELEQVRITYTPGGKLRQELFPAGKDLDNNYVSGNVIHREDVITKTKGTRPEDLQADDSWK